MKYRPRGFHYLGNLGSKLADLQGYATLAQELIQNADDVADAGWVRFDVAGDALVVDNGGVFSTCGRLDEDDCPWLEEADHKARCDFHRFAWIGSGDKRLEADTTGAFGIGFLSVYQITDVPELLSAGQHWILNELAPEHQRIRMCDGCARCSGTSLPGTRFFLPWVRDPNSRLRRELRAQPFRDGDESKLVDALRELLPDSMLFLRHLERIELAEAGRTVLSLVRECDGHDVLVQTGADVHAWHRYIGSFDAQADALRLKYPDKIEAKRSADVAVAFSEQPTEGRLFAWLPTQESTGIPCHIHADFYPANDRKHLLWDTDYRSEWNQGALEAAARTIRVHLEAIRDRVGHVAFWQMCQAARALAEGPRDRFRCFWGELLSGIRETASVYTQLGTWSTPDLVTIVDSAQRDCLPSIEALGIVPVHEDLDFVRNILMDRADGAGVRVLRLSTVNERLRGVGISSGTPLEECPGVLRDASLRAQLWMLLDRLLGSPQASSKEDRDHLSRTPVPLGSDGRVRAPGEIYRTDDDTVRLFAQLGVAVPLLSLEGSYPHLEALSPWLSVDPVLSSLENQPPWRAGANVPRPEGRLALLGWFALRQSDFEKRPGLKARLAALPLFPSGEDFRPLSQLSLPGAFEDPLGLAELIDVARVRGLVPFLELLGTTTLSLARYVKEHLPRVLQDARLTAQLRRDLLYLLADRGGELRDDPACQRTLATEPIVECSDGTFVKPVDAYFESDALRLLPADQIHVAVIPPERAKAIHQLLEWLGVDTAPRFGDLRNVVVKVTGNPPSSGGQELVRAVFAHLGERLAGSNELPGGLEELRTLPWLPAQGDASRWWSPRELAASFSQDLFASQATFLDVDRNVQGWCRDLINLLGIQLSPTVQQVVRHLLYCSSKGIPVSDLVYQRLSDPAWSQDRALDALVGRACIYLPDRGYVIPQQVFWSEHGFGKYRFTLAGSLRNYARFLDRVGVRASPQPADAVEVLSDIGQDPALKGRVLDLDTQAIVQHCWSVLADAYGQVLSSGALAALRDQNVVPDAAGLLNKPTVLFFEDRPNLATHFKESLGQNVIPLPERTAAVMEAAGVRRLSRHLSVEVLECEDRTENYWLQERLAERIGQLRRATVAAGLATLQGEEWLRLNNIRVEASTRLMVRYACDALGRPLLSVPQFPRALFLKDESTLIVEFRDGQPSWADIAREVALAVYPGFEPGRIASVFMQALAPESADAADEMLDALGIPRLAVPATESARPATPIAGIGAPAGGDVFQGEPQGGPLVAPVPTPAIPPVHTSRPPERIRPRSRYVTYVAKDDQQVSPDPDRSEHSRMTETAGIQWVKLFEEAAGRTVRIMPPNHPGYDIESSGPEGCVERYIEVKALSGSWGADGVGLTSTEFRTARDQGDRYWLYVVERVTSDDPCIYRIQDPARKASWFFFDHGWSEAAEP